jgi:choline-sulfatase
MSHARWMAPTLWLLSACSHTGPAEPLTGATSAASASAPGRPLPSAEPSAAAPSAPGTASPEPAPGVVSATAPVQVRLDLLAHPEHAELRQGDVLFVDCGAPGDAKYTLNGWLTGTGGSVKLDGARVRLAPGKTVKLALPAESDAAAQLTLRVRGLQPGPLTVYVNDQTLANAPLSGKGLETVSVKLPAGLLKRGENVLQLRVARTGSAPGVPSAGLGLDWLALAPATAATPEAGPPELGAAPGPLALPDALRLGYTLLVPAGARLRGTLDAGTGRLQLVALRDGAAEQSLGQWQAGSSAQRFEAPLGALADELVRLELRASAGAVTLSEAQVVVDAPPAAGAQNQIKNVIVILVDTLRADKLSAYNEKTRVKTPGLSTFLTRAAVFKNARTQENWTKPSVATLLSSLMPWQHTAYTEDARVPESVELLPERLRARGFHTGAFIANGYVSDKFGFKQGWNTYRNYIREGLRTKAEFVAADVLDWLDNRPKDKPFFLYMHTIDPHVPYRPPERFLDLYDAQPYAGIVDFGKSNTLLEEIKIGKHKLNERDKVRLRALYDAEITYHDVHFAAVLEGLKKRGLEDDTLVVMTADHGEEFWDHGSVGHGHSVYDELLHIPMIVRVPGLTDAKQQLGDDVGLVDVVPSVLEALGEPIPADIAGRSFLPLLRGENRSAPASSVSGFMTGWRTAAQGKLKLVQRTLDKYWLYDTAADPGETHDLAPAQPLALRHMRGVLGLTLAAADADVRAERPRAVQHKEEKTVIDKQTEAQLRALGYVGSSAAGVEKK